MSTSRNALKRDLLGLLAKFNSATPNPPDHAEIMAVVDTLAPLSPIADPNRQLAAVAGGWSNLYAAFGVGHSKGKSHLDDSTLALQTFKAFPDIPIHIVDIMQEIGLSSNAYNNVVLFQTPGDALRGAIIIHGIYEPDLENPKRFRIIFDSAEIIGMDGLNAAELGRALGLNPGDALSRPFKPARLYSDVIYLDEDLRINIGGMGGVYVLERRAQAPISL